MYIGPWQDYNLARMQEYMQRKMAGGSFVDVERQNANFKSNLEQTIINSLDPFSARKVLASLQPLLTDGGKDRNDGVAQERGNKLVPQLQIGQNISTEKVKLKKSIRKNENKGFIAAPPSDPRSKKANRRPILLIKESISQHPQIYKTEDDENINTDRDTSTPPLLSIRSTLSEPTQPPPKALHGNIVIDKKKKKYYNNHEKDNENNIVLLPPLQQQQSHQYSQQQPPYNTANAISLLRLERSMRQQKQVDLSSFWDWKGKKKQEIVVETDDGTDAKLDKVNKMKELYISKGSQPLLSPLRVPQHKPTVEAVIVRPSSPDVKDMDITDNELLLISKYFKSSKGIPPNETKNAMTLSFMNDSPPDTPSNTSPAAINPLGRSPAGFDELYAGGIDGLLNWSNNLDLDSL